MNRDLAPKHAPQPSVNHYLQPTISRTDHHLERAIGDTPDTKWGFCCDCHMESRIYRISPNLLEQAFNQSKIPLVEISKHIAGTYYCGICIIGHDRYARYFAVLRGYIWYLIGTAESAPQPVINRTLWKAASRSLSRFREGERARLRTHLAQCPPNQGFEIASTMFTAADQEFVLRELRQFLDVSQIQSAPKDAQIIHSTLGMHHLLTRIEDEDESKSGGIGLSSLEPSKKHAIPPWFGNHRYFVTLKGLERVAHGLPLGRDLRSDEEPASLFRSDAD